MRINKVTKLSSGNRSKRLPNYLLDDQVKNLIDVAYKIKTRSFYRAPQIVLSIELGYYAGLRISESIGLKKRNFEIDGNKSRLRFIGKGDKERIVPVSNTPLANHLAYMFHNLENENDYFLLGVTRKTAGKWITRAGEISEINKKITSHTLRHSYGRALALGGVPINRIAHLMGHEDISTTWIYQELGLEDSEFNLKEVFSNDG